MKYFLFINGFQEVYSVFTVEIVRREVTSWRTLQESWLNDLLSPLANWNESNHSSTASNVCPPVFTEKVLRSLMDRIKSQRQEWMTSHSMIDVGEGSQLQPEQPMAVDAANMSGTVRTTE